MTAQGKQVRSYRATTNDNIDEDDEFTRDLAQALSDERRDLSGVKVGTCPACDAQGVKLYAIQQMQRVLNPQYMGRFAPAHEKYKIRHFGLLVDMVCSSCRDWLEVIAKMPNLLRLTEYYYNSVIYTEPDDSPVTFVEPDAVAAYRTEVAFGAEIVAQTPEFPKIVTAEE